MTHSYLWLSIANGCLNHGNFLIEKALREIIEVRGKEKTLSAFHPANLESRQLLNEVDFVILPGATLLEPTDNIFLSSSNINKKLRVFAPGIAFNTALSKPDLSILSYLDTPIGSRDPYTHKAIIQSGGSSFLVGCPTLFLGKSEEWVTRKGPIIISIGKGPQRELFECARKVAAALNNRVILLNHVPKLQYISIPDTKSETLYSSTVGIDLYSSASLVITSRLHALLPCIAFGTPFVFLGGWIDSRYSLINHLNISVTPPEPALVMDAVNASLSGKRPTLQCFEVAESLRKSMINYIDTTAEILNGAIEFSFRH